MNGAVVYMQVSLEVHSTEGYYTAESALLESSFAEWTVKWWQWVYSIPKTNNPPITPAVSNQRGTSFKRVKTVESQPVRPIRIAVIAPIVQKMALPIF